MYSDLYGWRVKVGSFLPVTPESAAVDRKIVLLPWPVRQCKTLCFPYFSFQVMLVMPLLCLARADRDQIRGSTSLCGPAVVSLLL